MYICLQKINLMKLIKKSSSVWIIRANQMLANAIGSLFLTIGIVGSIYLSYSYYISCAIKQPGIAKQCRVYNPFARLFGIEQTYQQIDKAKIISRRSQDKKSYSLRLYTSEGKFFIRQSFNNQRKPVKIARNRINQYIQSSQSPQMKIPNYVSIYPRLLLLFFIPFSLVFLYIAAPRTIVINKRNQQLSLSRKLLGLLTIGQQHIVPLQSINRFVVAESNSSKNGRTYQLMCDLNDGSELAIQTVSDGDKHSKQSLAEALNAFIK